MINSQLVLAGFSAARSISKGMGDQFSASAYLAAASMQYIKGDGLSILIPDRKKKPICPVYKRGWVINSQPVDKGMRGGPSISKGMGDQFSARADRSKSRGQYIKGDG